MSNTATTNREEISGLFSTRKEERVGTGTTQRKQVSKTYWFVCQNSENTVLVQPLNEQNIPAGPKTEVSIEELLETYSPELEYYQEVVFPAIQAIEEAVGRAEDQRSKGALYSAEFEFGNALALDEENVRANFGLGLTYMDRGDTEKAKDVLSRIVELDAPFQAEHKHLFNEFGISLRKSGLYEEALQYYTKALDVSNRDENLYYNIARVYYQLHDRKQAQQYLAKALQQNSKFKEAQSFMDVLKKESQKAVADLQV